MSTAVLPSHGVGLLLRDWRRRRRLSQLDLAVNAEVSTRHLSFVETGRSKPSRELVLHLAEHLDVPLRERNDLLLAAGYAPAYRQRPLDDEAMELVRAALDKILAGHEPYPAVIVDRGWIATLPSTSGRVNQQAAGPRWLRTTSSRNRSGSAWKTNGLSVHSSERQPSPRPD